MIENDLDKILNYMKRYVENVYEHDSEIMLNWKDIKLVLEEIERLEDEILTLETERDILKGKLSEIKADIHYLLENGENIYIRNKYIRSDKDNV